MHLFRDVDFDGLRCWLRFEYKMFVRAMIPPYAVSRRGPDVQLQDEHVGQVE